MKKLSIKLRKKQSQEPAQRITTDTLAEHREQVLAGGRKFKYPVQYQRHRLVINALIVGVVALVLLVALGWYMLYVAKNTSEFMYRVTKVVPVPVAYVDGQPVNYSDYLMKYRSGAHYLVEKEQIDENSADGKSQLAYVQSQALSDAIADAYAAKLAPQLDVSVSDADVETYFKQQLDSRGLSEATYDAVIKDYYDWSPQEYRDVMHAKLLRQKVTYALDKTADQLSQDVENKVKSGTTDLKAVADQLNAKKAGTVEFTAAAWVPKDNDDGGLAIAAGKLKKGQVSTAVKTDAGDGYYYVKLLDSNDSQLQYEYIRVPLTQFNTQLDQVKKDKLTQFIKLEDVSSSSDSNTTDGQ